jgi:hypothetical protein
MSRTQPAQSAPPKLHSKDKRTKVGRAAVRPPLAFTRAAGPQ